MPNHAESGLDDTPAENESLGERLLRIGGECAPRLIEPYRSADHADLLYDERGLPK